MHAATHPLKIRGRLEGGEREIRGRSQGKREIYLRKDPTVGLGGDLLGKKEGPTVPTIPAWESSVAALAHQGVNPALVPLLLVMELKCIQAPSKSGRK